MRILLFGLLAMTLGLGCVKDHVPPTAASSTSTGVPFLALGDSYTIGEGVPAAERWPVQLARLSETQPVPLARPDIIARTGWTTAELQAAIDDANNQKTYGLVSLLIGVNNQYRGQGLGTYRNEFRELLHTAVRFAGGRAGRVVVLSIPDWGQSPFAQGQDRARIGREIDEFNAVARQECQQAGIAYVDITDLSRDASGDATQFAPDGLHYSGRQMQQWAQRVLPVATQLLQTP
jgi:lysophospholipase L1-like esterase